MREMRIAGVLVADLVAWALVVGLSMFAAAYWDPFWGFFVVLAGVVAAWLAMRAFVASRAPTLSPPWRSLATGDEEFREPAFAQWLFASRASAPMWLVVRVFLGWQWLHAGWEKLTGDGWVNQDGAALGAFWQRIVVVPAEGRATIQYGWYRDFIQFMLDHNWETWFAVLIAVGETVVGLLLIVGLLTGLAALAGATMNFNFMLAGSASTNPVLFGAAVLLLLSWKVAGWIGLDRWVLPLLGTPWQHGLLPSEVVEEARHHRAAHGTA
ncbi:MAG: DoxX family membrane protein [Dehalococcoidia bacterium]